MTDKYYENFEDSTENFTKRKRPPKPKGKRSVKQLKAQKDDSSKFDDEGLQNLYEAGYFDELVGEIKSGKEATTYLIKGKKGYLVAKLYRDAALRSCKNNQLYYEGRFISKNRRKRVLNLAKQANIAPELAFWVQHEYNELWALHQANIPAPKPVIDPKSADVTLSGRVVVMAFIGNNDVPALRLADASLTKDEVQEAYLQSLSILIQLLKIGRVHGDFSTFNMLWHEGKVILIDFPQMVHIDQNPHAFMLLKQDVDSLCSSFAGLGLDLSSNQVFDYLKKEVNLDLLFSLKDNDLL